MILWRRGVGVKQYLDRSIFSKLDQALSLAHFYRRTASSSSSSSSSNLSMLDKQLYEKKQTPRGVTRLVTNYADVPVSNVRSLSVIAHIDHGKSTLSDKLLEHCENIWPTEKGRRQVLDTLEVERQRGITVKAQSCSLLYKDANSNEDFLINLVDTPGHVDFSFEVGRSLAACQGALLLVDCSQGVQAQTVANHNAAKEAGLKIIPVLTKIDLPTADPEPALAALEAAFGFQPDEAIWTSAKSGAGIADLFPAIISRLPPPLASRKSPLRCLLFDSWFDEHRGVICCVQVVDGILKVGDVIVAAHSGDKFIVQEVGLMAPQKMPVSHLSAGHIGYVICGMKNVKQAILGDTFFSQVDYASLGRQLLPVLKGFKPAKPMVFASLYPVDSGDFSALLTATERLTLNDASVSVEKESSSSLGFGLRCGFLGLLHMDVFNQRLQDEFKTDVIITAPMVAYKVLLKNGKEVTVERPADFPPSQDVEAYFEPTAHVSIMAPGEFLSPLLGLLTDRRGVQEDIIFLNNSENNGQSQLEAAKALLAALPKASEKDTDKINVKDLTSELGEDHNSSTDGFAEVNTSKYSEDEQVDEEEDDEEVEELEENETATTATAQHRSLSAPSSRHHQLALTQDRVVLKFIMPWAEVVSHLADNVKSMTAGYASLDWMPGAYKKSDIVKVDMLMNSKPVDALSFIAHRDKALSEARRVALKLKGAISRQMFEINIQAAIGSKIVAKERIPPFRKDVLIKSGKTVGGGDKSRKEKLLSKQREGKRRMKTVGNVELPQAAFLSIMSSEK
jgi:elongation factor 4